MQQSLTNTQVLWLMLCTRHSVYILILGSKYNLLSEMTLVQRNIQLYGEFNRH